jgi:hypothetical protein
MVLSLVVSKMKKYRYARFLDFILGGERPWVAKAGVKMSVG